ncbi:P-loop containing nucleoside triphosphate hydrolase [Colletotrichum asianum]
MEPIAAFALAGNVLQFAEFAGKLLKDVWQILGKGQLNSDAEAALNAERMVRLMEITALETSCQEFHTKIHDDLPQLIEVERMHQADQALCSACQECLSVASEFLAILDEVKVQSDEHQKDQRKKSKKRRVQLTMNVIYAIFLRVWNKDRINDMSALLKKASDFVQSSFLVSISTRLDFMMAQQSERFRRLSLDNQMIITSLLSGHQTASRQLESQVRAVSMLLSRVEHVVFGPGQGSPLLVKDVLNDNTNIPRKEHSQIVRVATSERQQRHSVGREILKDLQIKISRPRYDDVVEAHEDTFHWIFEHPDEDALKASKRIWSDFAGWLRSGSGVYWVSGKPASGKSTLMKYVVSHERTHELLQEWSANFPNGYRNHLCTAKFFFWLSSGDKNQSSQVGLLRSILHEVCSEYPQLLPTAFPDLWSKRYYQRVRAENEDADNHVGVGYRSLPFRCRGHLQLWKRLCIG